MTPLYVAVMSDPVTRRRLAEWTVRALRPLNVPYSSETVTWQPDGCDGIYMLVSREYVAWAELSDFLVTPEASA